MARQGKYGLLRRFAPRNDDGWGYVSLFNILNTPFAMAMTRLSTVTSVVMKIKLRVERTTRGEKIDVQTVMDGPEIIEWQKLVREVILAPHVQDYIVRLTLATHPGGPLALRQQDIVIHGHAIENLHRREAANQRSERDAAVHHGEVDIPPAFRESGNRI